MEAPPPAEAEKPAGDAGLDFDLDLDALAEAEEKPGPKEAEPRPADTGLDFDIGDLTPFEPATETEEGGDVREPGDLDLDMFTEQAEEKKPAEESFDLGDVGGLEPPPAPRREKPEPEEPGKTRCFWWLTTRTTGGISLLIRMVLPGSFLRDGRWKRPIFRIGGWMPQGSA